jgi:exopolysaccharide biosynthesis polyprenyl glycosylphosphotransferase
MIAAGRHSTLRAERVSTGASDSGVPRLYTGPPPRPRNRGQGVFKELFRWAIAICEMFADFLTCVVGISAGYSIAVRLHAGMQTEYPFSGRAVGSLVGLCVVLLLQRDGDYRGGGSLLQIRETERAIRVSAQSLLLLVPFSFLFKGSFSHTALPIAFVLTSCLLILQKQIVSSIIRRLHAREYERRRVVIYGTGESARRIASTLLYSFRIGLDPVAVIDDDLTQAGGRVSEMGYRRPRSVPVHRGPLTPALLQSCRCDTLLVAIPHLSSERLTAAAYTAQQAGLEIRFLFDSPWQRESRSADVDGLLLTSITGQVAPWPYAIAKRALDLIVSSILLVLLAPLLLLIGLLVRLDSPGPALFVQKRVGRNGRLFKIYKFRSMYMNASRYDFSPTTSLDPRITRLGRFLRRTCLDELPQLMNVLRGTMSLVGPRPEMPFIVQNYNSRQRQRLQVLPGITGMWQLSADRARPIHENLEYDLYYIRNCTFFMDIAILIHTLFFAVGGGV